MRTTCSPTTCAPTAYAPPAFSAGSHPRPALEESPVATFVATILVILTFFASTAAWCWFVCRRNGGVRSCNVGWYTAKARCRR